ncbi:hypothetical protein FACS189427_02750 [Planctomycetales bacterium]|nr:hypothetical protein FACS189427_02750 [Planctomycetales bacterium]
MNFQKFRHRVLTAAGKTKNGFTKWTPYQLRHTAFTEVAAEYGTDMADVFVGHLLKTSGKHYDNSAIERQWYVVSRRQDSLALKSEFVPAS